MKIIKTIDLLWILWTFASFQLIFLVFDKVSKFIILNVGISLILLLHHWGFLFYNFYQNIIFLIDLDLASYFFLALMSF